MHKIVAGRMNIYCIRKKVDPLITKVARNIDVLLITETKTLHFPESMTVILMAVASWFMFTVTLGHV